MKMNHVNKLHFRQSKLHCTSLSTQTLDNSLDEIFIKTKNELGYLTGNNKNFIDEIEYKYDYESQVLNDEVILKERFNPKNYFSLSCLYIDNSIKSSSNTVLHNIVKTLALYVSDNDTSLIDKDISYEDVKGKDLLSIKNEFVSKGLSILQIENNHDFTLIEFDSQDHKEKDSSQQRKLVALIQLKTQMHHLIKLKELHHIGKYIHLKLIDQLQFFTNKITTIDIVSFLCFGKMIEQA